MSNRTIISFSMGLYFASQSGRWRFVAFASCQWAGIDNLFNSFKIKKACLQRYNYTKFIGVYLRSYESKEFQKAFSVYDVTRALCCSPCIATRFFCEWTYVFMTHDMGTSKQTFRNWTKIRIIMGELQKLEISAGGGRNCLYCPYTP